MYVAHLLADHWLQTQHQAETKGKPGWEGRIPCAVHVAGHILTQFAVLAAVIWRCDLTIHPAALTAGVAVNAVTHYIADRRTPLARLAAACGKADFHELGQPRPGYDDNRTIGTGAYVLDQSWHIGWILVAALIMA